MNFDHKYINLLQTILNEGTIKKDRTGTGTKSIFASDISHDMSKGFPLLTTKKLHFKSIVHELIWFLKGETNIQYLKDNGVTIWNEWADENGELGPIYGKQWTDWNGHTRLEEDYSLNTVRTSFSGEYVGGKSGPLVERKYKGINQIQYIIDQLKTNPDNRRLLVSAWNVDEIDKMKLPPCHYSFQFYTREMDLNERIKEYSNSLNKHISYFADFTESNLDDLQFPKRKISILWNQRSVDTFLGLPYNIASYSLLLSMIGHCVNMIPEKVKGNLGDTHLYLNHIDQAKEQINRDCYKYPLPTIKFNTEEKDIFKIKYEDIELIEYNAFPNIKAPIAV